MSAPLSSKLAREMVEAYQSIYASSVEKELLDQEEDINEGAARNWLNPPRSQSADPVVRRGGSYTGPGGAPEFLDKSPAPAPRTALGLNTPSKVKPGEKYGPGDGSGAASRGTIGGLIKKDKTPTPAAPAKPAPAAAPAPAKPAPAAKPAAKPATAGTYSSQFKKGAADLGSSIKKKPTPTMKSDLGGRLGKALSGKVSDFQFKDSYDMVLDYLISEGHVASVEEAHHVMLELDKETIRDICKSYIEEQKLLDIVV